MIRTLTTSQYTRYTAHNSNYIGNLNDSLMLVPERTSHTPQTRTLIEDTSLSKLDGISSESGSSPPSADNSHKCYKMRNMQETGSLQDAEHCSTPSEGLSPASNTRDVLANTLHPEAYHSHSQHWINTKLGRKWLEQRRYA